MYMCGVCVSVAQTGAKKKKKGLRLTGREAAAAANHNNKGLALLLCNVPWKPSVPQ